ncbi:RNA polymerase sigma factor [Mucilaginibacter puniceus]
MSSRFVITDNLSDEDIVERVVAGDIHLYEVLIRRLNVRMFRICMSFIGDDMEAEDIMQNTYINAYRDLAKFNNKAKFSTWITRILINECILRKRKLIRQQQILSGKENMERDMHTPLKSLINKELKGLLESAITSLPEKYRTVFVMREVEEMSTQETMDILDIEESNVKIRLMRAKIILRSQLNDYYKSADLFDFHLTRCDKVANYVMQQIINYYPTA